MPLGLQVLNSPGTVLGFSGTAFRHGVAQADGARVCHALYMRESLQRFTNVRPCGWMTQEIYSKWIGTTKCRLFSNLHQDPMSI